MGLFDSFGVDLGGSKESTSGTRTTERKFDQKAIDNELKGLKKANLGGGELTTRLKKQILSINGNYDAKTVRDFVDNFLIAKDSIELRLFMVELTPDIDMSVDITLASGKEVLGLDLPMTGEFFFPGSGI
jgi:hypothetical protein